MFYCLILKYGEENALFIGEVSLDLTRHRGTIGMHRATMSHKDPSWYDGYHRGTMTSAETFIFRLFFCIFSYTFV
jgi:hypothetical protein